VPRTLRREEKNEAAAKLKAGHFRIENRLDFL
jgi:hypothetical protein